MRGPAKHLTKGVAIYGAGDAAIQLVNFFLTAVYVKFNLLTPRDFGGLALLLALEAFAKVISRWGLDGAFMRFYLDRDDGSSRQQFASTIVWFILGADLVLFGGALLASGAVGRRLFDSPIYLPALRLMLINIFLISVTFVPFHTMRMRNQAATYSAFSFARSVGTMLLRPLFVIVLHWGVTGLYLADLVVTIALWPWLWRWFGPLVRPMFSTAELRTALRFGLPRVPHGMALQVLDGGNKMLFKRYIPQAELGIYQNGTTLGTVIRFFTTAFETAWAPFYYATARQPNAKEVFRKMVTYGVAVVALLVAGTTAVAREVILLMLKPEYLPAATIIPIIALGMGCQAIYLLTSIGLNLTSRTEFYPVATFAAAGVGLGSGLVLMPRYGLVGAAIAFLLSYATQAGVAFALAQRFYPISYEVARLARVVVAATAATLVALWIIPPMSALAGFFVRGTTTVAVYLSVLALTAFFRSTEVAFAREVWGRLRRTPRSNAPDPAVLGDVD